MYRLLGTTVIRYWPIVIGAWIVLLVLSGMYAPPWERIAQDSDVTFLPEKSPSRRGDHLFHQAFPDEYAGSSIVLVLSRQAGKLSDQDNAFIKQKLTPDLSRILADKKGPGEIVTRVRTPLEVISPCAIPISQVVDPERISAEYSDGVLTLHLPKKESAKPKALQFVTWDSNGVPAYHTQERSRNYVW